MYQNVRLLPLALFSSFVDPLGIIARGGEMRDALRTFADGMKGVTRQWGDMIREEHAELMKLIAHLKAVLADEGMRLQIVKDETLEIIFEDPHAAEV